MPAVVIGVRHHSPACSRLVAKTIEELRPAYVLIEGPADINDRIDELLLGHQLPIAIFSSYRDNQRHHASWAPMCEYSPEWVALTLGRQWGAEVRFIDLPAWHEALAHRRNRYADADQRYAEVTQRLCEIFAVDNTDVLWDHLFEAAEDDGVAQRLTTYFDLARGECEAGEEDTAREAYMAEWINAAIAEAADKPVVVVTGGFHRPALIRLTANPSRVAWPQVPQLPEGALGGSYLVPYSFKRLDSFDGYQSGMPSPEYYQRLWNSGLVGAADGIIEAVVRRLRQRRQGVSTADLIAAKAMAAGLARMRGHRYPSRTDVLDGLVSALVSESMDVRLPWSARQRLEVGTHPAVVEMVAALSGTRVGRLHRDTPAPPLVHDVTAELERHGLSAGGDVHIDLTIDNDLDRSRVLHRLRILKVSGYKRHSGPATGVDPVLKEYWSCVCVDRQLSDLIEAGAYGGTLFDAAVAALEERISQANDDIEALATVLCDSGLCGIDNLSDRMLTTISGSVATVSELAKLGRVLAITLGLWRHDRLLGTARSPVLGTVITAGVNRVLWLAEGVRGESAAADIHRIAAIVATRDAYVHAEAALGLNRDAAVAVMSRIVLNRSAPPDLRGAAFGFCWSLGEDVDAIQAVRGIGLPTILGDWLAGLFALAREEILADETGQGSDTPAVVDVLDEMLGDMADHDFLISLPSLRQAFGFFPPKERETIAQRLLRRRSLSGTGRVLTRPDVNHEVLLHAHLLESRVTMLLTREGLVSVDEVCVTGKESDGQS